MSMRRSAPLMPLITLATVVLVGCGSDAPTATASEEQIRNRLAKDPDVLKVLNTAPGVAAKRDVVIPCIAKAFKTDADGDALDAYVKGSKTINDLGGKDSSSAGDVQRHVADCVKNALSP